MMPLRSSATRPTTPSRKYLGQDRGDVHDEDLLVVDLFDRLPIDEATHAELGG
jgi:hypothetical protein